MPEREYATLRTPLSRRAVIGGLASGLGAPVLASCASPVTPPGAPPKAAEPPATITYAFWGDRDSVANHETMARSVMEHHANITVQTMHIPDDYFTKLTALFAAASPPDTALIDMQEVQALIKQQVLLDLTPLVTRDKGTFKPEDIDPKFLAHIRDASGKLYGLPRQQSVNCIFFNENLFAAVGLPSPLETFRLDRWTWEAFLTAAQRTTKRDPSGTLQQLGIRNVLERCFIWANGGKEFDDSRRPTHCFYGTPEVIEALQLLAELRYKHRVHPTAADKLAGGDDFVRGNVAMATNWTSSLNSFKAIQDFAWSVVPYPKKRAYATDSAGLHPLCVAKSSKAQEAGWRLVSFIAGPEGQLLLAREGGFTPVRTSLIQEAIKSMGMPQAPLFTDYQKYGQVRLVAPGRPEIAKILATELAPLWAGMEEARTAGLRAADKVNLYLQDNPQG